MHENVIAIEGTSNLRDIGGYPTRGGGRVRRGMVFRSEALVFSGALTKASIYREDNAHAYKQISVRTIVDLRGAEESKASPSAWAHATGAELIAFPMDAGVKATPPSSCDCCERASCARSAWRISLVFTPPWRGGSRRCLAAR